MTRREEIIEILSKEEKSAQELANYFQIELSEIIQDLEHIKYSIKPRKLAMKHALCKKCGFVFKERSKVKKPSKCPRCKSEWITPQVFSI
ncbi:transcriptional regulator [Candidatus Woesearchaeota archaeon]|nr:transcriptional regulator [Candidatus Woesearchaeota archaeon]